jgi:hypothetical protein
MRYLQRGYGVNANIQHTNMFFGRQVTATTLIDLQVPPLEKRQPMPWNEPARHLNVSGSAARFPVRTSS